MSLPESLVRAGVDTVPSEFAIIERDGTIRYVNDAWREFAIEGGFPGDPSMTGENYVDACRASRDEDAYAAAACDGLEAVLRGEREQFSLEYPCPSPEDPYRWFIMWTSRFTHDGDVYAVVEHLDITDRRRTEEHLSARNRRLASLASILSHDLRNPLGVAAGYAELLDERVDGDEVERIQTALERMDTIIDDALTLTRRTTVECLEPVDLETCSRRAWAGIETAAATLTVEESTVVEADASLLQTLFENLFKNSVDHGGTGVSVHVGLLDDGFFVADDGPGIPVERREAVFDPGYTTRSSAENTGLGLAIVASVVDAHEWHIELADDGGARFEVRGVETVA